MISLVYFFDQKEQMGNLCGKKKYLKINQSDDSEPCESSRQNRPLPPPIPPRNDENICRKGVRKIYNLLRWEGLELHVQSSFQQVCQSEPTEANLNLRSVAKILSDRDIEIWFSFQGVKDGYVHLRPIVSYNLELLELFTGKKLREWKIHRSNFPRTLTYQFYDDEKMLATTTIDFDFLQQGARITGLVEYLKFDSDQHLFSIRLDDGLVVDRLETKED